MEVVTKERFNFHLSDQVKQEMDRVEKMHQDLKKREKERTPPCPDGSGELGAYSPEATKWFGSTVYATRSEPKKYFYWIDSMKKGKLIDPEFIPPHLR